MLFNIFISDPGDRMKCTLPKCVDVTKHGEIITVMEYKAIQRNLNKMQECPSIHEVQQMQKCEVLHLEHTQVQPGN